MWDESGKGAMSKSHRSAVRCSSWALLISASLTGACTPETGTRTTLTRADLATMQRIAVRVEKKRNFSVLIKREETPYSGSLVVSAIMSAVRTSSDKKVEDQLKPLVGSYDPAEDMDTRLRRHLQEANHFTTIERLEANQRPDAEHFDAALRVTITDWGFRGALGGASGQRLQPSINVHAKLVRTGDGRTVWQRHELYRGAEPLALHELRTKPGLVTAVLSEAADHLAGRIVNEILFP